MSDATESSTSSTSLVPSVSGGTVSSTEDVKVVILHQYNLYDWDHDRISVVSSRNQDWDLRTEEIEEDTTSTSGLYSVNWKLYSDALEWADIAILFDRNIGDDVLHACYRGITAVNPKIKCGKWSGGYMNDYSWLETEIWRLIRSKPQVVEEVREVLLRVYLHHNGKLNISKANAILEPLGYHISPNS